MTLISGLFKIVCASCPAHVVVREWVRYQDGLLIHYECHGEQYLAAMHPYIACTIAHKNGERYRYSFNVIKPDVSFLREPVDCVYVLDTDLDSLSPEKVSDMHQRLAEGLTLVASRSRPSAFTEEEWADVLTDGRKALDLLGRFKGEADA